MKPSFLDSVLRGAEALAARDSVGLLPDAELLSRFATDRDASVFAVLVRRHGPLVWGVCRNLLLEDGEAEDAFQATFLALVKSSSSIKRPEALGAWLHGVAYRVGMKARRSAARRKKRESASATKEEDRPVADGAWDELQAAVHEEVCRLPEKLRLPFVLVGLQGRPQKEAAKQLGWAVGTFSARLCQARQRLLDRLAKRNMPIGLAAGATALGLASGTAAVPNALVAKALNLVAAPDAVTPLVLSLSQGVTHMYLTRTKLIAAGILLAGVLTTGIGSRLMSNADAQSPDIVAEVNRKIEELRAQQQAKSKWEYKFVPMQKPLPSAELRRVLASHDVEGWDYCGAQEIVAKGQPVPHLTFKRLNKTQLETNDREKTMFLNALKAYEEALQFSQKDMTRDLNKQLDPEVIRKLRERREQDLYEEAVRQKVLEAEIRKRAGIDRTRALEAADRAKVEADMARKAKAAAEAERERATQLQRELEALQAERAALLKKLEAEKEASGTSVMAYRLQHVEAAKAWETLQKMAPGMKVKVSTDARTNSLIIQGTADQHHNIMDLLKTKIDVAASKPSKQVTVMVNLSDSDKKEIMDLLVESIPKIKLVANGRGDQIVIMGSAEDVERAKALLNELSKVKPAKSITASVALKNVAFEKAVNAVFLALGEDSKVKCTIDAKSNFSLTGPAEAVMKAKKLLEDLDRSGQKPK